MFNSDKMIDFQQKRIEWICECLIEPSSLETIIKFIEQKVNLLNLNDSIRNKGISQRTIEADIKKIRLGQFLYKNEIMEIEGSEKIFHLDYDRLINKYAFKPNTERPIFDSVSEIELLTMPFIDGALDSFKTISGVNRIINEFQSIYSLGRSEDEYKIVETTSVKMNTEYQAKKNLIIQKAENLIKIIHQKKPISFMYSHVSNLVHEMSNANKFILFPYQVRIHDGMFYLIALDLKTDLIKNFRIDNIKTSVQILELNDPENDELENTLLEKYKYEFKRLKLDKDFFKFSLGVWCHNTPRKVYRISIDFYGWAASHVQLNPLHQSQTTLEIDENKLKIAILLNLVKEPVEPFVIANLSPELAFTLGKYREFYSIDSIVELSKQELFKIKF
jgi:hypothetical protein